MAKLKELHEHASRLAEVSDDWRKAYFAMYGYAAQAEAENEQALKDAYNSGWGDAMFQAGKQIEEALGDEQESSVASRDSTE